MGVGRPFFDRISTRPLVSALDGGGPGERATGVHPRTGGPSSRLLQIIGSTLRALPDEEKARTVAGLVRFGAQLERAVIRPVIDRILPLERASEAHGVMKASQHFGKIVLQVA